MGSETLSLLKEEPDFELVNLLERSDHPLVGSTLYDVIISSDPYKLDLTGTVFCDFTTPHSSIKYASLAAELGCPILIGSTGFTPEEYVFLENLSVKIPVMIAPNLSRGVDLLYRLTEVASRVLKNDFDAEIVETHHKWKKDAPSGTAKALKKIIKDISFVPDVSTHSLRMGDITGEHRIIFAGEGETLEITHKATSRRAFARGVPIALRFLSKAKNGLYSFRDGLEL